MENFKSYSKITLRCNYKRKNNGKILPVQQLFKTFFRKVYKYTLKNLVNSYNFPIFAASIKKKSITNLSRTYQNTKK